MKVTIERNGAPATVVEFLEGDCEDLLVVLDDIDIATTGWSPTVQLFDVLADVAGDVISD